MSETSNLPICPGKRWQHPQWWTYHPPVHDRAPAPLATHLGKLCGIALGHLKPIPGSGSDQQNVSSIPKNWWQVLDDVISPSDLGIDPGFAYSCHVQQGQGSLSLVKKMKIRQRKHPDFWWLKLLNMVKPPFPSFFHFHHCLLRFRRKNILEKKKRTRFYRLNTPINVSCSPPITSSSPVLRHSLCCATSFWASVRRSSQVFTIPFSGAGKGM